MTVVDVLTRYVLTYSSPSRSGQVAEISGLLNSHRAYIEEISVFDDEASGRFHLRCVFRGDEDSSVDIGELREQFGQFVGAHVEGRGRIRDVDAPPRVLILVSKYDHCLRDLLQRRKRGELRMDVAGVVSNHVDLRGLVEHEGLKFHHLPVTAQTKSEQEEKLLLLIAQENAEYVVLARYMQVLSAEFCARMPERVINIHHSFLPGFKGAKPYHQAHERGVKLIGATAHFATPDLDEGPIIEQAVERVDHAHSATELLNVGRHVECLVLARALRYVLEQRVFVCGHRTIVLR